MNALIIANCYIILMSVYFLPDKSQLNLHNHGHHYTFIQGASMFSNKVRFLLSMVTFLLTFYSIATQKYYLTFILVIGLSLLIVGYYRYNSIWLAFNYMGSQRLDKVKELLLEVKYPHMLARTYKGFYHMLSGAVLLYHDKNLEPVAEELKTALEYGVRTPNNISIIYIMYAQLFIKQEDYNSARDYIQKAKETSHKDSLDGGIAHLEAELSELDQKNA